jgi:membrane-associated HD superfamily phosphohydrolase
VESVLALERFMSVDVMIFQKETVIVREVNLIVRESVVVLQNLMNVENVVEVAQLSFMIVMVNA